MATDASNLSIRNRWLSFAPDTDGTFVLEVKPKARAALPLLLSEEALVEEEGTWNECRRTAPRAVLVEPLPVSTLVWTGVCGQPDLRVEERVSPDGDALVWKARFTNRSSTSLHVRWRQSVSGIPAGMSVFAPSATSHYALTAAPVVLGYRDAGNELSMPLVAVHATTPDVGVSFLSTFEGRIEPFAATFRLAGSVGELAIDRRIPSLAPGASHTAIAFIVGHDGCWRPGLGWARERFRRFFYLPDKALHDTQGCFLYSAVASEGRMARWQKEGARQLEIHMMYPHLGKYVPLEEPWLRMIDDRWSAVKRTTDPNAPVEDAPYEKIREYMHAVCDAKTTREDVRQFMRRAHAHGLQCYNYFQPTESWEFFADDYFPEAILHEPDGSRKLTWYDHVQMNCSPETRWGQYLIDQLEGVFAMYPELDGIFMDQAAEDDETYRVKRITDLLAGMVESRGKWCWWNGPYIVELIEHAVGMLAEGGSIQGEMLKYLTIGDKGACGLGSLERQYQRNLVSGLWPSAPSMADTVPFREAADEPPATVDPKVASLHERYMPLFRLFKGKTWVLEPRPLDMPAPLQGNVFQRPNGDYLVALIDPSHSGDRPAFRWDVLITIRVSGARRVKAVYGLTPDCPGTFSLPFERRAGAIEVKLPRLKSACLLHLPIEGVIVSVAGEWARPPRSADPAILSLDNWDEAPRTVSIAAGSVIVRRRLAPGESRRVRLPSPRANRAKNLWELPCTASTDGNGERRVFSWFIDRPVELAWQGYLAVVAGVERAADLAVLNRSAEPRIVDLRTDSEGLRVGGLPRSLTLEPGERRILSIAITASEPGERAITVAATERGRELSRITDTVHCWRSILGTHGLVPGFGGYVQLTGWMPHGSNHGTEWALRTRAPLPPVPVRTAYLNGKPLGRVSTRNYRGWHPLYTIGIAADVIPFLSAENELVIEPDGPDDFFKVKNARMNVILADGQILATPPVHEVYSSRAHELAEGIIGAPVRIRLAFP
jgi:hypothetical protein